MNKCCQWAQVGGRRRWRLGGGVVGGLLLAWALALGIILHQAARTAPDALLVLGGSIQREIYVAKIAGGEDRPPILISQGSPDPCIWLVFQRADSALENVWLEKCARSTFGNFVMALPVLEQWQARHVQVVTSASHLPRAGWLGKILLGSHGIWVEVAIATETGIPGNQESWLKTSLDVVRSLGWAVVSQVYQPRCSQIVPLAELDWPSWQRRGFQCEHQAGLSSPGQEP